VSPVRYAQGFYIAETAFFIVTAVKTLNLAFLSVVSLYLNITF
jgi:hypothetical protein